MSEFVNSSETLGSIDAVVDALVAHNLSDFKDDSVVKLGKWAFYKNNGLQSVELPSLTDAGTNAFEDCTAMTGATFAKLKTLGQYMFKGCTALTTLSFPELTATGQYAFQNCTGLVSISFPSGVTSLQSYLFSGCTGLKTVSGTGLTRLEQYCFSGCTSLETNSFSGITYVGNYAFQNCSKVGVVAFPACTSIGAYLGQGNGPTGFDFSAQLTIPANAFNGSANMQHLVLRSSTLCPLQNVSAFTGTPLGIGLGYIYVPSELVDTYKAASNWSTFASQIQPISAYPKAASGTISDTWAQILEAELDGTYTTKYSVGDSKIVDIDGTGVLMKIVAMNADVLTSDTSKTAPITWISAGFIEKRAMNATQKTVDGSTAYTAGGWANTDMRTYLRETLFPKIETVVKENIKEVNKTSRSKSPTDTVLTSAETVWIPSSREIFGGSTYEDSGPEYTTVFNNSTNRIKKEGGYGLGSAGNWWLRSANSANSFRYVDRYGYEGNASAGIASGLVLGFCT